MSSFKASTIKPRQAGAIMRSAIALGFSLAVSTFSSNVLAGCSYTIVTQWGNGFQAGIKITNTNPTPINGWDVTWRYSGDNRVNSSWNVNFSGQNPYTARNVSWNGTIQPGQSVEFGFVGTKGPASAEMPVVTGAACAGSVSSTAASSTPASIAASSTPASIAASSTPASIAASSTPNSIAASSTPASIAASSTPASIARSSTPASIAASSTQVSIAASSIPASSRIAASSSSVGSVGRLDNPFVSNTPTKWYVNQDWAANARAYGGASIADFNTAVWMDRIGAIAPTDPNAMGLRDHLDAALDQGANLFLVVIYDLPNRDCFALASNGELKIKENGFNRYKNEYITPLAAILADPKYQGIRIVAIIEPDSLPNLVTNTSDPDCQEAAGAGGYVEATQFTLNALYPITNVYSYIDIGHSGWLGWPENLDKATALIGNAIKGTTHGVNSIAGFISNTANSTPLKEPFLDEFSLTGLPGNTGSQVRQAKFYEWNPNFSEFSYVNAWRTKMLANGFPSTIGMLVDTSRNGWGGAARPKALSTSTNVDTFVDESRIDRRTHRGMWCNQASGIGERPTAAPAPGIDAYVWVKPPGESDGVATAGIIDPTDPAKGFDRFCDPTYTVPANGKLTGAMAGAPHAGRWFTEGFKALLENAYPALNGTGSSISASSRPTSIAASSTPTSIAASSMQRSSTPVSSSSIASSVRLSSSSLSSSVSSAARSSTATCTDGTQLFCLDFENVAPGATPAGFTKDGSGIAIVEGQEAHSGNRSVKFKSSGYNDYGFFRMNSVSATHWGRLYYKMKTPVPNIGTWLHGTFVTSLGNNAEFRFVDTVQESSGKHQYIYNSEPGDVSLQGAYAYTFDSSWVCTEWYVDSQSQTYRFFRDGQELFFTRNGVVTNKTNLSGFTAIPSTLNSLGFGFRTYQQSGGVEGWLDDVAVGSQRIGCGNGVSSSSMPSSVASSSLRSSVAPSSIANSSSRPSSIATSASSMSSLRTTSSSSVPNERTDCPVPPPAIQYGSWAPYDTNNVSQRVVPNFRDFMVNMPVFNNGVIPLPYNLHQPAQAANSQEKFPLVIYLHGGGERGKAQEHLASRHALPFFASSNSLLTPANLANRPTYIVAPQCECEFNTNEWSSGGTTPFSVTGQPSKYGKALTDLIENLKANYKIDPDRIYVTGISMGGGGAWELAARRPDLIAAAIPMSGIPVQTSNAAAVAKSKVVIWAQKGNGDENNPVSDTTQTVNAITAANGCATFSIFPTGTTQTVDPGDPQPSYDLQHTVWMRAYLNPQLWDYVFSVRRAHVDGTTSSSSTSSLKSSSSVVSSRITSSSAPSSVASSRASSVTSSSVTSRSGAVLSISTSGNKVLFGGQVGSVSGMSMFWSNTGWGGEKFYNAQAVSWLKTDWNAKLVRAAMGVNDAGGYLGDASNKARAMAVIDGAIANDMYVIIDFHSHVAHQYQAQSIAFFQEMATKYGNSNNIIYEIYNEPLQVSWSSVIKPYAVEVIKAIRAIDPDNLIIVGTPTWSQDVDAAAADPIVGYPNIAYTLHFYAGTHGQSLRDKATTALNRGIPLFVTEWGSVNADGNGGVAVSETNAWVAFMKANNISNANWSLTDKAEGSAALVAGASGSGGWVSSQLTASGALAKSIVSGWTQLIGGSSSSSRVASSIPASSIPASSIPASSSPASSKPASSSSISSRVSSSVSSLIARNNYNAPKATIAPVIDGQADAVWNSAEWAPIDVRWLGSQAGTPPATDYSGRYKAMWDSGNLYLLFDITDDRIYDGHTNPLDTYWDDDTVELFIDENRSGGQHEFNTSAWAYHVSTLGDVVDYTTSGPKLLNDHVTMRKVSVGDKHMWEMSVRIYDASYADNRVNTPLSLTVGKLMGFSAAYIDNDGSSQRESMMGSVDTQGHKDNKGYQDASVFGTMQLVDPVIVGDAARGKTQWENPAIGCVFCHAVNSDGTAGTSSKIDPKNLRYTTLANLVNFIELNMPKGDPTACVGQCAADTAAYFLSLKPVVISSAMSSSSIRSSTPVSSTPLSSVRSSVQSSVQSSVRSSTAVSSSVPVLDGATLYVTKGCVNCHGARGESTVRPIVLSRWTRDTLIAKIAATMPANNPGDCQGACATAVADYILTWRPVVSCTADEDVLTRRLRLLTNYEYANTVNDLLNISTGNTVAAGFEADVKVKFFNNDVEAARMTNSRMDAYWNAAESLAKTVSMTNLLSCDTQVSRDQCANTFVPAFGKKAFRRPLSPEEQTSYLNLFKLGATNEAGARLVIQGMLSSSGFLYRTELGSTVTGNTTLTAYEAANLLSYTFTGSMPDATLFTEADNNRLTTSAQLRTQAERLLGTPKASTQLARFGTQWLKVDDVANLQRDPTLFPAFTPAIGTAMKSEVTNFLNEVFLKPGYKMGQLFNPGFSFVNGPLASYYGMSGVSGDQFQKVTTNAQRGGVLHMGAITASMATMKESHPIHRGLLVRRNLLCQDFAPPPPNVGEVAPLDPNKPTRERFAAHTNNTNCQSCHQYIDHIGFGFENYDAVGRYRTIEGNNLTVDASGDISGLSVMTASDRYQFNDLRGLSTILATDGLEATSKCLTKQYQRFATGISEPNECAVNASYSRWQSKSTDLRDMLLETVTSPTFLTRK